METYELTEIVRTNSREMHALGKEHGATMMSLKIQGLILDAMKNDSPFVQAAMAHLLKQVGELKI